MVKQTSKGRGRGARSSNTSSSSLAAPASPGVSRFVFKIKMDEEQAQTYSPIKKLPVQVGKIKFTKDRLQDWKASRCFHTSSSKINIWIWSVIILLNANMWCFIQMYPGLGPTWSRTEAQQHQDLWHFRICQQLANPKEVCWNEAD